MKNPYVFLGTMLGLLVAGFFVGKYWNTWFPSDTAPSTPADGTGCTTTAGELGIITAGVCVGTGGPNPNNDSTIRTTVPTTGVNGNPRGSFLDRLANGNQDRFSNPVVDRNAKIQELSRAGFIINDPRKELPSACEAWVYCDGVNDPQGCKKLWNECVNTFKS